MTYRKVNRKRVNRRVKSVRSKGSKKLRGGKGWQWQWLERHKETKETKKQKKLETEKQKKLETEKQEKKKAKYESIVDTLKQQKCKDARYVKIYNTGRDISLDIFDEPYDITPCPLHCKKKDPNSDNTQCVPNYDYFDQLSRKIPFLSYEQSQSQLKGNNRYVVRQYLYKNRPQLAVTSRFNGKFFNSEITPIYGTHFDDDTVYEYKYKDTYLGQNIDGVLKKLDKFEVSPPYDKHLLIENMTNEIWEDNIEKTLPSNRVNSSLDIQRYEDLLLMNQVNNCSLQPIYNGCNDYCQNKGDGHGCKVNYEYFTLEKFNELSGMNA